MKITRNIPILAVCLCVLFACNENKEKKEKNTIEDNAVFAEKLAENFGYTDFAELDELQKSFLKEHDFLIKEPLHKSILESMNSGALVSYIEQADFNRGFMKSAIILLKNSDTFKFLDTVLFENPEPIDASADELESFFIEVIKYAQSEGLFSS